jgi:hypothetical protein
MDADFTTSTSPATDNLAAGEYPRVTEEITVVAGQNLTRGAVLGKITASGKWRLSVTPAAVGNEGSETPRAILVQDTDASAADKEAAAYRTGEFNQAAITLGAGHTVDSVREGLADVGIFLKSNLGA